MPLPGGSGTMKRTARCGQRGNESNCGGGRTRTVAHEHSLPLKALPLMALRPDLVAGILDRAGAHPAPHQDDVLARGVVEAMPAAARRIDHVAFTGRLVAA